MYFPNVHSRPKSSPLIILSIVAWMLLSLTPSVPQQHLTGPSPEPLQSAAVSPFGEFPLRFVPNEGQFDAAALFQAQSLSSTVVFTPEEIAFLLPEATTNPQSPATDDAERSAEQPQNQVLRLRFVDANLEPPIEAGALLPGRVNDIRGNDPARWYTHLPTYADIEYGQLYPGIDLRYQGTEGWLKGFFAVAPGADPTRIRWRYAGAEAVTLSSAAGDLLITLPDQSQVIERAPVAWQEIDGERIPVPVAYALASDGSVGFALGAYDASVPLAIDPTIVYETAFSGAHLDHGLDIAVDAEGNVYVVAFAYSGDHDVLVAKIAADGRLLYTTYLSGSDIDYGLGIVVDDAGGVYIAGWTDSSDFPTLSPLQDTLTGFRDAFVTKLSAQEGTLVFSTYLGGDYADQGNDIALNSAGEIYLVGATWSTDFPVVDPIQGELNGFPYAYSDAFVTKLSGDGSTILYSTYLGGSKDDEGRSIALDGSDRIYIAGETYSTDFPMQAPIQPANAGERDVFVARMASDGSALEYSTYLGGEDWDRVGRIAVDGVGSAHVTGSTQSVGFPTTPGAYQEEFVGEILGCEIPFAADRNCTDVFVSKLWPDGSDLAYSTYLGGIRDDEGRGMALDSNGAAHVVGYSFSPDFPPSGGTFGTIITSKLDATGSDLLYTLAIESASPNAGHGIAVDGADDTYITGAVNAPADVYVAKISDEPSADTLHVDSIVLRGRVRGRRYVVDALVVVRDRSDRAVGGAEVAVEFTVPPGRSRALSRTTDASGRAFFRARSRLGGQWEVCVTDIVKAGLSYDPSQNKETCDSIMYP